MSAPSLHILGEHLDSRAEAQVRQCFRACPPEQFLAELIRYLPTTRHEEQVVEMYRGWALLDRGENIAACPHLVRALRRSSPTSSDRALLRGLIAEVSLRLGQFDRAERCTHRALADLPPEDPGSYLRVGHLMHLGRTYRRRGHIVHALATHRRALALIGPGTHWWHPLTLNLVMALLAHGDVHEADALVREHQRLAETKPPSGREWMTPLTEAFVSLELGDLARCEQRVDELMVPILAAGERAQLMKVEIDSALARARGDWERSERALLPALEDCQLVGRHSDFVATFARELAESLEGQGRYDEALEPARLAIHAGIHEDRLEWCLGLHVLGRCLVALGRRDEARRTFREALGVHERCEFHLEHGRLLATLSRTGFSELATSASATATPHTNGTNGVHATNGMNGHGSGHAPLHARSLAAPRRVLLRDGREFLTCDRALLDTIELAAASPLPVLIEGETGTGKELVARPAARARRKRRGSVRGRRLLVAAGGARGCRAVRRGARGLHRRASATAPG
jgi:Flp pilus assembly protein TadD